METLAIELTNPRAMRLLEDLEALQIIRVVRSAPTTEPKLSARLRGSISPQAAEEFNESIRKTREEWERDI